MAFRVGQKVVCIGWEWDDAHDEEATHVDYGPDEKDIGTITNIVCDGQFTLLELAEWPTHDDDCEIPGWDSRAFRPIVERKTDISIFAKMLKPKQREIVQ